MEEVVDEQARHLFGMLQQRNEVSLIQFIGLCQPSLDPDEYETALGVCRALESRQTFRAGAVDRALDYLKRDVQVRFDQ